MAASRKDVSDEAYWSSSQASNIKAKGVNLFDDGVDFEDAKSIIKTPFFDSVEEDEADTINWDGSPHASNLQIEYRTARYRPPPPAQASTPNQGRVIAGIPVISDNQMPSSKSLQGLDNVRRIPGSQSFSGEPSLDDVVGCGPVSTGSVIKKAPTLTEMSKLEAEINYLKRQLEASRKDRFAKIPPLETVKRIINGQPYSFELYKSKEDKLLLLDEAIRLGDGNSITAIILFMKDHLKASLFTHALMERPMAMDHYISYLRQHMDYPTLVDWLCMLGRTEEAAMIKYKQAASVKNVDTKLKNLEKCHESHFATDSKLALDASLVKGQMSLLKVQSIIEEADIKAMNTGDLRYKGVPRECSILDKPVIYTLYYCCVYHYDKGENFFNSPRSIKKEHMLSDKQFVWTAIKARSKFHKWNDIEELFTTKGWFGGTKLKPIIPFEKLVAFLHEKGADRQVLNKYCALIDDIERRLEIAGKYGCFETAIETFKNQRDRQLLMEYTTKLKPNSQEWFYAQSVLKSNDVKWKT